MNYCVVCNKKTSNKTFCNECKTEIKLKNPIAFKQIVDEWKLEAKQEDVKYFYFVNEADDILKGKKNFVIGRKGEGKTAIAQYICKQSS